MLKEIIIFILAVAIFAACADTGEKKTSDKEAQHAEKSEKPGKKNDKDVADDKGKSGAKPLTVTVEQVNGNAPVVIRVYTEGNFLDKEGDKNKYSVKPEGGKATQLVDDLPYGEVAVVAYQDENNNGDLDRNGVGVPQEPYAFSKGFKPTVKAPDFSDCKVDYTEASTTVKLTLPGKK